MQYGTETRRVFLGLIFATTLGLGACGGGGGDSSPSPGAPTPAPTPTPPADSLPVVAAQPQSQSVGALGTASFSVTSANTGSYQWQKSLDDGATWIDIAEASAATLSLPRVALVDGGMQFRAKLTNANGSSTSNAVKLTVRPNVRLLAGAIGGPGFRDGPAAQARLNAPRAIAMDGAGNAYIADGSNHVLRRLSVDGTMSTLAGVPGLNGRTDGPATQALFDLPRSIAIGPDGAIWSVDQGTCLLRKTIAGQVTTVADLGFGSCAYIESSGSRGYEPADIAVAQNGDVYVSDMRRQVIWRVDASGAATVFAGMEAGQGYKDGPRLEAWFDTPRGLAFDGAGNLYVVDRSRVVRRIAPDGMVTTIAGTAGQVDLVDGIGAAARFASPRGLVVVGTKLLVADSWSIRQVDLASFAVTTLAGVYDEGFADGVGAAARFNGAIGIAASNAGSSLVTDANNHMIRRVTATGVVTRVAGERDQRGTVDAAGAAARFSWNNQITADTVGNLYAAETYGSTIRKISPDGVVSTFAGKAGEYGTTVGLGSAARFVAPKFIAAGKDGNLYVADTDFNTQCGLRQIQPDGYAWWFGLVTYACYTPFWDNGYYTHFGGMAVDATNNLALADKWGCVIFRVASGRVQMITGSEGTAPCGLVDGPAGTARIARPTALVYEPSGALLFVDQATIVRRLKPDGSIETVAGNPTAGYADGIGNAARFRTITAMAVDSSGRVYVVDSGNHSLRLIEGSKVRTLIPWNVGPRVVLGEGGSLNAPVGIALLPGGAVALTTEYGIVID